MQHLTGLLWALHGNKGWSSQLAGVCARSIAYDIAEVKQDIKQVSKPLCLNAGQQAGMTAMLMRTAHRGVGTQVLCEQSRWWHQCH